MMARCWRQWISLLLINTFIIPYVDSYAGVLVLTVDQVVAFDIFDPDPIFGTELSEADFYAFVLLDGDGKRGPTIDDQDSISPQNWKFSTVVDLTKASIPVVLQIYDEDGGLRFDDELAYISPDGGAALSLQVVPDSQSSPTGCQILGPISGRCGDHLHSAGTGSDYVAEVHFTIELLDLSSITPKAWDVLPHSGFDINHLLNNPVWGWQLDLSSGQLPPDFDDCPSIEACTQQYPTADTPDLVFPGVCHFNPFTGNADGHLNWEVVSYSGTIEFDTYDQALWADGDINFFIMTSPINGVGAGATRGDPSHIKLEMKDAETIDHFGQIPFWNGFREQVLFEVNNPQGINGREAIAIGLLGLDRVHPPSGSELHPLYALAIHTKTDPSDDQWAVFGRNFGNEGMCSSQIHLVDFGELVLQLPRPPGVASSIVPTVTFSQFAVFAGGSNPVSVTVEISTGAGQDTFITFKFGPVLSGISRASGEVHLNWQTPGSRLKREGHITNRRNNSELFARDEGGLEPEDITHDLYDSLTADQKAIYLAMMPPQPLAFDDGVYQALFTSGMPPPATSKPNLYALHDPESTNHLNDLVSSFCGAFAGHLPDGLPGCGNYGYTPFTRLMHSGQESGSGWYTTPVIVTLEGVDVNGEGIDHIEYHLEGQDFVRYTSPFQLPEGVSTIFYRAEDRAGSIEATKQAVFQVDTILPQILPVLGQPQYTQGDPIAISEQTPLSLSASDSGSGILSIAYRFYLEGSAPIPPTVIPGGSAEFTLSGPDGIYLVEYSATDVAGNVVTQMQRIRLTHVADLAIVDITLDASPPPFVVVDSPIQLTVETTLVNLGFVNPVDSTLTCNVVDTPGVTLEPKIFMEGEAFVGLNQPLRVAQGYIVSCQTKSSNTVIITCVVEVSGPVGILDNVQANNQKSLTTQIVCKLPWRSNVHYEAGNEVVYDGLVYVCRQAHTSQTGWEPPNTYALWQRIPVVTAEGSIWAPQVLYHTGDVVFYQGHHYRANQGHQSQPNWPPPNRPALWKQID